MSAPQVGDVITTAEELDAMPKGATVVIDDAEGSLVAVRDGACWHTVGMDPIPSVDLWDLSRDPEEGGPTPVVLVHLPGQAPRPERVVKAEALREAAHAWQVNGWAKHDFPTAVAPTRLTIVLGMAQRAADFLRLRANAVEAGESA